MRVLYMVIPIVLLFILGAVFFIVSSGSDDNTEAIDEETAATEETDEPAESVEEEGTDETDEDQENNLNEEDEQDNSTEEDQNAENEQESSSEENQNDEEMEDSAGNNKNYDAVGQCIMSELTECEGVSTEDQFMAYQNLVGDGTLPQSPVSDCLPCAVKYSFEAEYGESKPLDLSVLPRSEEAPEEINNHLQFVRQYLFSLPGYYNDQNNEALEFYQEGSSGQNLLTANKATGQYANHMTYSVHIDHAESNTDGSYDIYVYRTYSHKNTDGIFENYVYYNVTEGSERYYINGYEELDNVRIE